MRPQSGWCADDDDPLAASRHRLEDILRRRARCEPFVRLRLDTCGAGNLLRRLPRAEQRAREHGVRQVVGRKPASEGARGRASRRRQPPQLVRVARRSLGMAYEVKAHTSSIGTASRSSRPVRYMTAIAGEEAAADPARAQAAGRPPRDVAADLDDDLERGAGGERRRRGRRAGRS